MRGEPDPVMVWETLSCHQACVGVGASRARPATYFVYFEDEVMRTAAFFEHVEDGLEELGITTADALEWTPTGASTRLGYGSKAMLVEYHSLRLMQLRVKLPDGPGTSVDTDVLDALDPCVLWAPSALLADFLLSVPSIVQTRITWRESR